ncbi:MAG: DGQHR domain-containing protein [archaeon]
MICSCCGFEILDNKGHPIENGKEFVCERCWNNPDLFFPEKMKEDARYKVLSDLAKENRTTQETEQIQVIRLFQKNLVMYIGKVSAKTLLKLCDVDKFEENELTGYQRELFKERTKELVEYLDECPIAVMPSLFASVRDANFVSQSGDVGLLEIPQKKGAIWIIDGQHRIGGFERIADNFIFDETNELTPELFSTLMDYELPIVFLNSNEISKKISSSTQNEVDAVDLERAMFFIVNKTQKGINPSLRDTLLYRMKMGGINGIPALKKDKWRIQGASIAISLNQDNQSQLHDLINISGKRLQGKPMQLNSFVSSLEKLLHEVRFTAMGENKQILFLKKYWNTLGQIIPEAFRLDTSKHYMVLKALGVYTLNWIALDVLKELQLELCEDIDDQIIFNIIKPLRSFDWSVKTSPLSKLGGMKGVNEAHRLLLELIKK